MLSRVPSWSPGAWPARSTVGNSVVVALLPMVSIDLPRSSVVSRRMACAIQNRKLGCGFPWASVVSLGSPWFSITCCLGSSSVKGVMCSLPRNNAQLQRSTDCGSRGSLTLLEERYIGPLPYDCLGKGSIAKHTVTKQKLGHTTRPDVRPRTDNIDVDIFMGVGDFINAVAAVGSVPVSLSMLVLVSVLMLTFVSALFLLMFVVG